MNGKTVLLSAVLLAAISGGGLVIYNNVRGIRNNNPGNIRHGENWQGMSDTQTDSAFVQFIAPKYGIRALNKVLKTYYERHGLNTVYQIIERWAPPIENDTLSYAESVAQKLGVNIHDTINVEQYAQALTEAIIKHENGIQPYNHGTIVSGVNLGWA